MKKLFYRITALLLTATFLFTQPAVTTLAAEFASAGFTHEHYSELPNDEAEQEILCEVTERRDRSVKHFAMGNRTSVAILYPQQVHYEKDGKFLEIDNSLVENDQGDYVNKDSPMKITFSKFFKNKNLVSVNTEGKTISWSYIKDNTVKQDNLEVNSEKEDIQAVEKNKETSEKEKLNEESILSDTVSRKSARIRNGSDDKKFKNKKEEKTSVRKVFSNAKYENIDENIDLDYVVSSFEVKENIIIKEKTNKDVFKFEFKTNGLKAKTTEENGIDFVNETGKAVYTIPQGNMYDAAGEFSNEVKYEIAETEGGYIISVAPNKEWMKSENRIYPIVVDPPLQSSLRFEDIYNAYTDDALPNDSFHFEYLPVGSWPDAQGKKHSYKSYIKFKGMPTLKRGEMVVKANLALHMPNNDWAYAVSPNNHINVRKVNSSWRARLEPGQGNYLTDNIAKKLNIESNVADYVLTDSKNKWYDWDITKMTKEWYQLSNVNDNYGIQLTTQFAERNDLIRFVSKDISQYPGNVPYRPQVWVQYINYAGIEPYWSYSSHDVGANGTGMVNNYTGNLVLTENVFSNTGLRMPLTITNTYNNIYHFDQSNAYIYRPEYPDFYGYEHSSKSGFGWHLNFNMLLQKIEPNDKYGLYSKGYRYVYVDGDGTQHYFLISGSDIVDEDGLGFKLILDPANNTKIIRLKDKNGNVTLFEDITSNNSRKNYVLKKYIDNENNETNFYYAPKPKLGGGNADQVDYIEEPNGRRTTINYNDGNEQHGLVSSISHPDGQSTTFNYTGKFLRTIIYPDGLTSNYEYLGESTRLTRTWTNEGEEGKTVEYEYVSDNENSPDFTKIKKITEYGYANYDYPHTAMDITKSGNSVGFKYNNNNTTEITYGNSNPKNEALYGKGFEIWQFDDFGKVKSVLNEDGSMSTAEYAAAPGGNTDPRKNKISHTGTSKKYVNNLLKNSAAADGINNWNPDENKNFSTNPGNKGTGWDVEIENNLAHVNLGEKSFKVSQSNSTTPMASQTVYIPISSEDKKYTFSADVKIDGTLSGGENEGAFLQFYSWGDKIKFKNLTESEKLKTTDGDWRRISLTATAPAGATSLIFYFGLKNANGTAWFDRLQVEEGEIANDYNLVENSDFSSGLSKWVKSGDCEARDNVIDVKFGESTTTKAMKFYGTVKKAPEESRKNISQMIPVYKKNPVFTVSVAAHGNSVSFDNNQHKGGNNPDFYVAFNINYADGSQPKWVDTRFNPTVSDVKQYICASIPSKAFSIAPEADKMVSSIVVYLCYYNNQNTGYFDNVQVNVDDSGNSFVYDSKGNVEGAQDAAKNGIKTEINSDNEITSITSPKGYITSHEYYGSPNQHRIQHTVSPIFPDGNTERSVKTKFEYDPNGYGSVTKATTSPNVNNPNQVIETSATYSHGENYAASVTNAKGNISHTIHNGDNGNLEQSTSANNVVTNYGYDNAGRIQYKWCGNAGTNYVYHNGWLGFIKSNSVMYGLYRNLFGQITEIEAGGNRLVKNKYDEGNGLLREAIYETNQCVKYDYDKLGRIINKRYYQDKEKEPHEKFIYTYNNKSEL